MHALLMLIILSTAHVKVVTSNTAENNLLRRLLDTNEKDLLSIPAAYHAGKILQVQIRLALKKIVRMDEQNEFFHSQFWLQYSWKDYRLMWNISEFEGLDMIYIPVKHMWTPDVMLHNRAIQQTPGDRAPQSEYVRLLYDGTCVWWPMYEQSVSHCRISVTRFPFDEQRCYLVYESWKYNSSQLNITSIREPESVNRHFQKSEQWDLVDIYNQDSLTRYDLGEWSRSTFTLHLRRRYLNYVIHLIVPYCLFCWIAVFVFVIPPSRPERLNLEMTILLTLSVYQLMIQDHLPKKSGAVPIISIYFVFVFVMCVASLAMTIFIVHLHCRSNAVPLSPMSPRARRLICDRLASLLSFRTTMKPLSFDGRRRKGDPESNRHIDSDRDPTERPAAEDTAPNEQVLRSYLDRLETRISIVDEKQEKSDEDARIRREWIRAAAAIDRLCFIALLIIFIGGTIVFVILFLAS